MATFSDGSEVLFQGEPAAGGPQAGDSGRVLLAHDHGAHVSWTTGSLRGEVSLVPQEDLLPLHESNGVEASLVDSLWVDSAVEHHSASVLYSEGGAEGLISALSARGTTDFLTEVAAEAMDSVAVRVAQMVEVEGGGLDDEAKDDVVRELTASLFREMLSEDDDGG